MKRLRILDRCKAWPTSGAKTEGETSDNNKSIRTTSSVLYLERKNSRKFSWRHKKRKENRPSFAISRAKKFGRRKARDPIFIRLHVIRRSTNFFRNRQSKRRQTYSNIGKKIDRNPNFVARTSNRRFATLPPQHCKSFKYYRRTSIVGLAWKVATSWKGSVQNTHPFSFQSRGNNLKQVQSKTALRIKKIPIYFFNRKKLGRNGNYLWLRQHIGV
jgi:hypothetical protein